MITSECRGLIVLPERRLRIGTQGSRIPITKRPEFTTLPAKTSGSSDDETENCRTVSEQVSEPNLRVQINKIEINFFEKRNESETSHHEEPKNSVILRSEMNSLETGYQNLKSETHNIEQQCFQPRCQIDEL